MHRSPANVRRRAAARRRQQIRRRRAVALAILVTLVVLAIWAAYAVPSAKPARVPATAAMPTYGQHKAADADVVIAQVEGLDVLLPVAREVTTAVAYHPVDNRNTVPFSPAGERVSGGSIGEKLADIFNKGGGMQYYLMAGNGADSSSSTAGLDVGAVPGSPVVAPVDGKVIAVKTYKVLGRYQDVEVDVQLADDPSLLLVVTHVVKPRVHIGDVVRSGETTLGAVRGFPLGLDQSLSTYTSDAGDHLQMVVLKVAPKLAGL